MEPWRLTKMGVGKRVRLSCCNTTITDPSQVYVKKLSDCVYTVMVNGTSVRLFTTRNLADKFRQAIINVYSNPDKETISPISVYEAFYGLVDNEDESEEQQNGKH